MLRHTRPKCTLINARACPCFFCASQWDQKMQRNPWKGEKNCMSGEGGPPQVSPSRGKSMDSWSVSRTQCNSKRRRSTHLQSSKSSEIWLMSDRASAYEDLGQPACNRIYGEGITSMSTTPGARSERACCCWAVLARSNFPRKLHVRCGRDARAARLQIRRDTKLLLNRHDNS
jgi:hypothetical protein